MLLRYVISAISQRLLVTASFGICFQIPKIACLSVNQPVAVHILWLGSSIRADCNVAGEQGEGAISASQQESWDKAEQQLRYHQTAVMTQLTQDATVQQVSSDFTTHSAEQSIQEESMLNATTQQVNSIFTRHSADQSL